MTTHKADLYALVIELADHNVGVRMSAKLLGVSSSYVSQIRGNLGLTLIANLPPELARRCTAYREVNVCTHAKHT